MAHNTPPALQGVLEAALYVDDLDAADTFYGETLGLEEIAHVSGRHRFYRVGETVLLLFVAEKTRVPTANPDLPVPTHGAEGPGHLCFSATGEDLDAWQPHLISMSIAIEGDFSWPNGPRSIYVRDPAGNSVEVAEPNLWRS